MGHNDPYDIKIQRPRQKAIKVQVKTIGPYNKSKTASGIKEGHNEVHIVELNTEFKPCRYCIIRRPVTGAGKKAEHFQDREEIDLGWLHEI